jgi:hypothetical protein
VFPRFQPEPFSEGKKAYDTGLDFATQEDNYTVPDGIPEFSWPPQPTDKRFQGKQPALRFTGFAWMYCDGQLGTAEWCPGDIIDFLFDEYYTDPIVRVEIEGPAAFEYGHKRPAAVTPDQAKTGTDKKGQHRPSASGDVPTPYKVRVKADTSPKENERTITVNCYTRSGWKCSAIADRKDICGGCGSAEIGWAGIHYTTQQMACGESQTLTVLNPEPGTTYGWECTTGTLSSGTGNSVTYTAPATNPSCANNATVTLKANGNTCDYITVAVNCVPAAAAMAYEISTCYLNSSIGKWQRKTWGYTCDGTVRSECNGGWTGGPWDTEAGCMSVAAGAGNICCPCHQGAAGTHDCRAADCSNILASGCCPEVLI